MFAIPGDYDTKSASTVILKLPGLLSSHAGKFGQCFQLLDCCLLMSQKSAINSCEVDRLDEHAFAYPPIVWQWPVESEIDRDLRCLLLGLPG